MNEILKYYGITVNEEIKCGYFTYQGIKYYLMNAENFSLDIYQQYLYYLSLCALPAYTIEYNFMHKMTTQGYLLLRCVKNEDRQSWIQMLLTTPHLQVLEVNKIKDHWIDIIEQVKKTIQCYAYSYKHDYEIMSYIYYYCGLAETGIVLLNEILSIDPHAKLGTSLVFKCPEKWDSYDILNPAFYIISTKMVTVKTLLDYEALSLEQLQEMINLHYFNVYELLYLLARSFYNKEFFDYIICEKHTNQKMERWRNKYKKERILTSSLYHLLSNYLSLPKIIWLNL